MSDNFTIDADSLVSNAIGGVKLRVFSRDVLKAQYILELVKKHSIDNEGNIVNCPNCKSEKVELFSNIKDVKSFFWFIFGLFSSLQDKYKCEVCKTKFDLK